MGGFSGIPDDVLRQLMAGGGQNPAEQMSQQGQFNPAGVQAGPQPFSFAPIQGGIGINLLNALANAGKAATYVAESPQERQGDDARAQQLYETKQKMALAAGEFGQREKDRVEAAAARQQQLSEGQKNRQAQLDIENKRTQLEQSRQDEEKRHNLATEGKPIKPDSPEQQFIDWYLQSHQGKNLSDAVTAYTKAHTPPEKEPKQLAVTPDGTVVELKPGSKVPQGTTTLQGDIKQQQALQGAQTDINFANNYVQNKKFDGPHDEALIEKFFDMTKPSSGFRMTQPQIDMALHARSALQGIVAQGKHFLSPNAPYLDDTQRQNIVQTMNDVMAASQSARGPAPQGAPKQQTQPQTSNGRRVIDLTQ